MIDGILLFTLSSVVGILVALMLARRQRADERESHELPPLDPRPSRRWTEWDGSSFELILHLGPRNEDRLVAAIQSLWSTAPLIGPDPSPKGQPPPRLAVSPRQSGESHSYGRLRLGSSRVIGCKLIAVCGEDADDLILSVPRPILETHFGAELAAALGTWEIESAFLSVADRLFVTVPFNLGAIGEEVYTRFPSRVVVPGYDLDVELADYGAAVQAGLGTISGSEALDSLGAPGGVLVSPDLIDRALLANISVTVLPSGLRWLRRGAS